MENPKTTPESSDNQNVSRPRLSKRVKIVSAVIIVIIVGFLGLWLQPYFGWYAAKISCGKDPVLGVASTANGDFGSTGKVAYPPGDYYYNQYKFQNTELIQWYPRKTYYYCSQQEAAAHGFLTFHAVHPLRSFNMETPTFKIQGLLDQGFSIGHKVDDEQITYGVINADGSAKYPYYKAVYSKDIAPDKTESYSVYEFKPLNTVVNPCDTTLFQPHAEDFGPRLKGYPWQSCSQVGTTPGGSAVYLGVVGGGYNYQLYFSLAQGTVVLIQKQSDWSSTLNIVPLFNGLKEFKPDKVPHTGYGAVDAMTGQ